MMRIIVVGGVAGGATVGSQIRRVLPDADITIYEKNRDMSFANCGLPYYLGDEIQDRTKLVQATPEMFQDKKRIIVHTNQEITHIDTERKTVTIKNQLTMDECEDSYDILVLSPGCRSVNLPQINDNSHVFYLRNLEETDTIESFITERNAQNALIVGAGYISLELVENLKKRGLDITLLHRSEHLFKAMDERYNPLLKNLLVSKGITLQLSDEIHSINGKSVEFKSGKQSDFDIVIVSVGIEPNTEFIKTSPIELNEKGYIKTNEYFETSVEDIYALGDAIETFYRHTKKRTTVALAWGAHRAATLIANHIAGDKQPFKGLLATNIVRIFDHSIASVGIQQAELKDYEYEHYIQEQRESAGYMPDSRPISISYYVDKHTRELLRASIFGQKGVDKRIDIIATAMCNQMKIEDFVDIEVAYAPPYSSPKDIINMMGYKVLAEKKKQ